MQRLETHMAEVGEMPKMGLKERVAAAFTVKGAEKEWYRKHADVVKQYTDVNNGLTDEQRAQAMAQIEADATKSAKINVGGHWVALTTGLATLTGIGVGIAKPEWVAATVGKIKFKDIGNKLTGASMVAHNFVLEIPARATALAGRAKVEAGKAVNSARAAWEKTFPPKIKVPPAA